jgi:hypothetical protein
MADNNRRRSIVERLRELVETIREALNPRQPAPVPVPNRDRLRHR